MKELPYTIELSRTPKGTYGWSITVSGQDLTQIGTKVREVDECMQRVYGGGE